MATVRSNGVRLNVLRAGSGPPVLLLHGYLFGADWWLPQIEALRDAYDVVAIDLRGQMGSEVTSHGYDLWNQAEDVLGVIAQLGLAPVHVVGLSMGGMIALRLALRYPDAVRSLVLMDTDAGPELEEVKKRNAAMASVVASGELEAVLPALPPIFLSDRFIAEHRDQVDAWLARVAASDPQALVKVLAAIDDRDDLRHRLGEIHLPVLVIHGEDEAVFPLEVGERIAAGIPGAAFASVAGGHQSNVDNPKGTSRLIRNFLDTLPR